MTNGASEKSRYLLIWLDFESSIEPVVLARLRWEIEDTVSEPRDDVEVDVWLESPGGDAHVAFKLAMMLRDVAGCIRVVVPDYAKSAATLLTLVADELYLAPGAELGPLDAQIPEEGSLNPLSALNVARASDSVAQDAVALALKGAEDMVKKLKIKRVDALSAMLDFSANFSEPLVRQLDPRLVHQANELLRVTVRYATLLLTPRLGEQRATQIAKELVEKFPTHGFVISRDEVERLGLPVKLLHEYDLLEIVKMYHRASEVGDSTIAFGPLANFLPNEEDEDNQDEDEKEGGDDGGRAAQAGEHKPATVVQSDGHEAIPQGQD